MEPNLHQGSAYTKTLNVAITKQDPEHCPTVAKLCMATVNFYTLSECWLQFYWANVYIPNNIRFGYSDTVHGEYENGTYNLALFNISI